MTEEDIDDWQQCYMPSEPVAIVGLFYSKSRGTLRYRSGEIVYADPEPVTVKFEVMK